MASIRKIGNQFRLRYYLQTPQGGKIERSRRFATREEAEAALPWAQELEDTLKTIGGLSFLLLKCRMEGLLSRKDMDILSAALGLSWDTDMSAALPKGKSPREHPGQGELFQDCPPGKGGN